MILTHNSADHKVDLLRNQGLDIEWEGWNIVVYNPFDGAFMRKNGAFRNGKWCLKRVFEPQADGKYYLNGIRFNKK